MKLITYRRDNGAPEPGTVIGDRVVGLTGAGYASTLQVVADGDSARARVENWIYNPPADAVCELASVKLLAPVPRPPKLICVGLNYRDHAIESKMEIPSVPTIFCNFPSAVIGPGEPIV